MSSGHQTKLVDLLQDLYSEHYDDEIRELAQHYPSRRTLEVDYDTVFAFNPDLADDWTEQPRQITRYAEEALRLYELPVEVGLGQAHVRLTNPPVPISPFEISSDHIGSLVGLEGVVVEASDVVTRLQAGAFECQRCGTLTHIPQRKRGQELERPHECQGCEREGPFEVHQDQSEFVDYQHAVVEDLPSSLKASVSPKRIDVHLEDDIAGMLRPGEPVVLTGVVDVTQVDKQVFEISLDVQSVGEGESVEEWREEYLGVSLDTEESSDVVGVEFERFVERSRGVVQQGGNLDEDNTKAKIVTPFVHMLGWNVFDSSEVELEYPRQDDEFDDRADYALFDSDGCPRVVVEAKQVETLLDGFTGQVKRYMRLFGAEFGVLTNGERYMVYRREDGDVPSETLLLDCQLEELAQNQSVVAALSRDTHR